MRSINQGLKFCASLALISQGLGVLWAEQLAVPPSLSASRAVSLPTDGQASVRAALSNTALGDACSIAGATVPSAANAAPQGEDDVVATVKLGGEDQNKALLPEGVGTAGSYDEVAEVIEEDKSSVDANKNMGDKEHAMPITDDSSVNTDTSYFDPSRITHANTRRNARTMSLSVPAPRGMITDRDGETLAYSQVAYQPSIQFNKLQDASDERVVEVARATIDAYEALGMKLLEKNDEDIIQHYKNRRWLPYPIGSVVRLGDVGADMEKLNAVPFAEMLPVYIRNYPNGSLAGHIIGYTGSKSKLATGPINHKDPIFEVPEGRSGLEKSFNAQLDGRAGLWRLMFNERGEKILDELQVKPKPGGTVVTTLKLPWQRAAEKSLAENTMGRGAFVMIDCITGEIVVLATVPNFDPNAFIPFITQKSYDVLRNDPNNPLVSRAYAGLYPPASIFKTLTVAAALHHGVIKEDTYIYAPYSVRIGGHEFRNHSGFEGSINCVTALVLSNNPFMYKIAATHENRLGAARLCDMARRFGMGKRSGIPLMDMAGNVPNESWMYRNYGRGFMQGDAANIAIGQGPLLTSPLQVAHAIAGVANGRYLPKLQLIRQVLDQDGNVIYQNTPQVQNNLMNISDSLSIVRKAMRAVVDGGTGRRGKLSYVDNAAKTGTAQWGRESDDCRLAWFAGYLPADKPRYAYVALYEGKPHQRIAGGSAAAAIVKNFFESIKTSMLEDLAKSDEGIVVKGAPVEDEWAGEGPAGEETDESRARDAEEAAIQEAKQRAEKARALRNQPTGWDDGRRRN